MASVQEISDTFSALVAERDSLKSKLAAAEKARAAAEKASAIVREELSAKTSDTRTALAAPIHFTENAGAVLAAGFVKTCIVRSHVVALREGGLSHVTGVDDAEGALVDRAPDGADVAEVREVLLSSGARLAVAFTTEDLLRFESWLGREAPKK